MMAATGLLAPVQLIGYAATALGFVALAVRSDKLMKLGVAASMALWVLHFALLGVPAAAFTCGLVALRQAFTFLVRTPTVSLNRRLDALAYLGFTVIMVMTGNGPAAMLPWLAAVISAYALANVEGVALRWWMMASMVFWLTNAVVFASVAGIVANVVSMAITGVTLARMHGARSPAVARG